LHSKNLFSVYYFSLRVITSIQTMLTVAMPLMLFRMTMRFLHNKTNTENKHVKVISGIGHKITSI